jgi:hypothetical protein
MATLEPRLGSKLAIGPGMKKQAPCSKLEAISLDPAHYRYPEQPHQQQLLQQCQLLASQQQAWGWPGPFAASFPTAAVGSASIVAAKLGQVAGRTSGDGGDRCLNRMRWSVQRGWQREGPLPALSPNGGIRTLLFRQACMQRT